MRREENERFGLATAKKLAGMSYARKLELAADADGCLTDRRRLRIIASVCDYKPGWVGHVYLMHWRDAVAEMNDWLRRKYGIPDDEDDDEDDARGDLLDELNDERNDD